jgi:hypothetical protein
MIPILKSLFHKYGDYCPDGFSMNDTIAVHLINVLKENTEYYSFCQIFNFMLDPNNLNVSHEAWLHILFTIETCNELGEFIRIINVPGILTWDNSD